MLAYACSIIRVHLKSKLQQNHLVIPNPIENQNEMEGTSSVCSHLLGGWGNFFFLGSEKYETSSEQLVPWIRLAFLCFAMRWSTGQPFFSTNDPSTVATKEHNPIRRWTRNQVPATSPCNVTKQLPTRRINFWLMNFDHRNHAGVLNHTRGFSRFLASWV